MSLIFRDLSYEKLLQQPTWQTGLAKRQNDKPQSLGAIAREVSECQLIV